MEGFISIGRVEEFAGTAPHAVTVEELKVVVIPVNNSFVVIENRCPHQQSESLHEGGLGPGTITCPVHGRTFRLDDGRCVEEAGRLTLIDWRAADGKLWVRPPEPPEYRLF